MSAKLLKHADEIFIQEIPIEKVVTGQLIYGLGGHRLKVKEIMPCDGGFFVAFENAQPFRIAPGCKMPVIGQVVL